MIRTKQDYRRCLQTEIVRRGFWRDLLFREPTARFLLWLRRTEYHCNARGAWHRAAFLYCYLRYRRISLRTGISIPKNVCREGLTIPHYGSIVVNAACRIGRNCAIHNNVNIGASGGGELPHPASAITFTSVPAPSCTATSKSQTTVTSEPMPS